VTNKLFVLFNVFIMCIQIDCIAVCSRIYIGLVFTLGIIWIYYVKSGRHIIEHYINTNQQYRIQVHFY